jgi:alpha-beta hydrolase superfamily lysophospholipase
LSAERFESGRPRTALLALVAGLLATGCSTPREAVFDPTAEPVVFYESTDPATVREELEFTAADGVSLGYVAHRRATGRADVALVYLHGIESHAGWFDEAGDLLAARGFDVFCLDRRGSGINREDRGFPSGYVDSYETLFADITAFVEALGDRYDTLFIVGLSWGGKLAMAYALSDPYPFDGAVLITPGIRALVDLGPFKSVAVFVSSGLNPKLYIRTPIDVEMFSPTPAVTDRIRRDPRRLRYATARFFMQSHKLDGYVDDHMPANELPILLFLAGQDRIIDNEGVMEVLEDGAQATLDVILYEDQTHSIQFDAPERLVDDMTRWIREQRGGTR